MERPTRSASALEQDYKGPRLVPDPVLGWRLKPRIRYTAELDAHRARIEIGADGWRVVPGRPDAYERLVWVFGCSYTFGFLIDQHDTFCALLQRRFPTWRIRNFGVGGYSTFQNLLTLESQLASGVAPDVVVFCYMESHRYRNLAHPQNWRGYLDRRGKGGGWEPEFVPTPFFGQRGEASYRKVHPPASEEVYAALMQIRPDPLYIDQVGLAIAQHARGLVEKAGGTFLFTVLRSDLAMRDVDAARAGALGEDPFISKIIDARLTVIDAEPATSVREATFMPADAHPNVATNAVYAQRIGDAMDRG